jgi:lysine 2,3-aminomutase
MNKTLRSAADFRAAGLVSEQTASEFDRVAARYAVALTPVLADLIDRNDDDDPIAKQFVPDLRELTTNSQERSDPIGDLAHTPVKGIVHRYPDRVLLTPLLHCPVYCRFCFRRERVGAEKGLTDAELSAALDYIRSHPEIWEVVITGGDPLMLPPAKLKGLLEELERISHLQVIRLHSRIPVADPKRINKAMVKALSISRVSLWVAVHSNHPREFTREAEIACASLARAGIALIGQTVLLKGVNDDAGVLEQLFRKMVANRVKPYYLHNLDLASGTEHFRVPIAEGQSLMRELRGRLSGLCQPTYVLDIPGGFGKIPIGPTYLDDKKAIDWQGRLHDYAVDP